MVVPIAPSSMRMRRSRRPLSSSLLSGCISLLLTGEASSPILSYESNESLYESYEFHSYIMLEVRHLRTLIALAEAGTVSRAAERVHLTQSALSHQLKALESHYGLAMVKRHGQSVQLTEPGRRLVALGRSVMSEVQTAERDLARLARKPAGTLRIALECHTCFDWLMPIMDSF